MRLVSPVAPSQSTMPGVKNASSPAQHSAKPMATMKIWLAMRLAPSIRPAPTYWAIITAPATVTPEPKLSTMLCTGVTRLMAARGSLPICPSQ